MDDLTKIKGVLGCAAFAGNSPVAGTQFGKLGDKASEIEQFWATAASVVATNMQLGQERELLLRSGSRQVLLLLRGSQNVVCELDAQSDWKNLAAEIKRRL